MASPSNNVTTSGAMNSALPTYSKIIKIEQKKKHVRFSESVIKLDNKFKSHVHMQWIELDSICFMIHFTIFVCLRAHWFRNDAPYPKYTFDCNENGKRKWVFLWFFFLHFFLYLRFSIEIRNSILRMRKIITKL